MKKWFRRLMLFVATVMVILLAGALLAVYLARSDPDYFHPTPMSETERARAAASAEGKFIQIQNEAARASAANRAATHVIDHEPTISISFSEAELNSFFEKWGKFQNWKSVYEPYMSEPTIALRDGRLILAAKMREMGLIVSLQFAATIDDRGQLDLELARVMGGRLPLPETIIGKYERQLADQITRQLPRWQANARLDTTGGANGSAISVAMSRLFAHMLRNQPSEPLLFLPVIGQKGSVPVKILDVKIADGTITLNVCPLSSDEQAKMMQQIRAADDATDQLSQLQK